MESSAGLVAVLGEVEGVEFFEGFVLGLGHVGMFLLLSLLVNNRLLWMT